MRPLDIRVSDCAGFCWGVERALEMTLEAAGDAPTPVNTLGPLIHNPGVIAELKRRGVGVIRDPGEATVGTVILRSHGVPRGTREQLATDGLTVVDATCPFVTSAQEKAARLKEDGYLVIILGERDHPEVLGLRSYAGDDSLVVESPADLPASLPARRIGVVVQTTQSHERLSELVAHLAPQARELLVHNTICNATEQRQAAAMAMAGEVDAVVVVGGRESGNTRRLAELCAVQQPRTYHVESAAEIDPSWFRDLRTVGITAGASTPPEQIEAVAAALRSIEP
ncbi:MAG: 4-hydroxy-3-methylbut-2-enyl diphosphate reductase [Thermoleophilia bacterium]|nr:4-hydroxy-3-methylbut-2-enyl diphosphate reductase [Thermoleophilia bacterium]